MTILLAILIFGTLILVHELGHYTFARLFDVEIQEFAIGMGPKILSKKSKKTGITYSLRLIPIGGFVSMLGENEQMPDNPRAFCNKKAWKKLVITVAGAAVNILIGFILMTTYTLTMPAYGGTQVAEFAEEATSNNQLQVGDIITKVNGKPVLTGSELVYRIGMEAYEPIDIVVTRDGESITLKDVVFPTEEEEGITFGMYDFKILRIDKDFGNTVKVAFSNCRLSVDMVWDSLIGLVSGRFGFRNMSGVVGVTESIGEAAKSGIETLIYFCAIISVNLGIFNLLPIPALDGGHIVFHLIELIRGKPVNPKYETIIHAVGMLFLLGLVAFVTINDILKLF